MLFNKYEIEHVTWEKLINKLFRDNEGVWTDDLRKLLSLALDKVAHLYIEAIISGCYNSIKHGFRTSQNAISKMIIGQGDEKIELEGSTYGFDYGIVEKIENSNVLHVARRTANWNPEIAIQSNFFAGMMIHNVKEYIKRVNYKGKVSVEMRIPTKKSLDEFISMKDFCVRELTVPQKGIPNSNIISKDKIEEMLVEFDRSSGWIKQE